MRPSAARVVLRQVETVFQVGPLANLADGPLLERFQHGSAVEAEAAFAALVERHGPMVLHVCRRVLHDRHAAEDAAQATFLILAQRAGSVRRLDALASWLYGVAGRVAARARRDDARRQTRDRRAAETALVRHWTEPEDLAGAVGTELLEELDRLPERFRLPVLLCHLEGLTHAQAAERLGCPVRTVQSRLARARQRLRTRLIRRGFAPAVVPLTLDLAAKPQVLSLAAGKAHVIAEAAVRSMVSGPGAALVSVRVAGLTQGVLRTMICQRLLKWMLGLAVVGATAGGAREALIARSAPTEDAGSFPALVPAPALAPAVDPRFLITTTSGVMVEVVAVSSVPTGPETWWRPDGTRLAEPPVDSIGAHNSARDAQVDRVILARSTGLKSSDQFRWQPTGATTYWGGRPLKDGQKVPGLEYYEAMYPQDQASCGVQTRVAAGPWRTVITNDGTGGLGTFVDGHKFTFGKARPTTTVFKQPGTSFAVAHNFFGQDRRVVALDGDGRPHPAVAYSIGSDGDPKWQVDLIDAEFDLAPDQIHNYQIQFRPLELNTVAGIALYPQAAGANQPR